MAVDVREREALAQKVETFDEAERLLQTKQELDIQQAKWEANFFATLDKMYNYTVMASF